ncbi:unnamed protein product, partial [Porites evermanni]
MDLRKVSDEEKVNLCRKYTIHIFNYYYLFLNPFFFSFTCYLLRGFALLPFLWFINVVWFFKEAFIKPSFSGQSKLKS